MGGGGTPLYKLYRYVPPHRVGFLRRFGLKTGIHSAHFGSMSGNVVWFLRELRECMNVFIACMQIRNGNLRSNLSYDNIISA